MEDGGTTAGRTDSAVRLDVVTEPIQGKRLHRDTRKSAQFKYPK